MSENTQLKVVEAYYQIDFAYTHGYNQFKDTDTADRKDHFYDSELYANLENFYQSAMYANHVLPRLRSMAGYGDSGAGTYTVEKEIAAIKSGCEEDEQPEAELVSSSSLFDKLSEAWERGALDSLQDKERYTSELPQW